MPVNSNFDDLINSSNGYLKKKKNDVRKITIGKTFQYVWNFVKLA